MFAEGISIIMPVYNSANHLPKTLECLLNQTFTDFELICVDDGSTDNSLEILKEFQEKFGSKLQIIPCENSGAGAARNYGFSLATRETTLFLDSDDYFHPEFLQKMYTQYKKTQADIVICWYNVKIPDGRFIQENVGVRDDLIPDKEVFNKEDFPLHSMTFTNLAPWNKLFRTGFIKDNNLKFDTIKESNDVFFTLSALFFAKRITTVPDTLIVYNFLTSNSTALKRSTRVCTDIFDVFRRLECLFKRGATPQMRESLHRVYFDCFEYSLSFLGETEYRIRFIEALKKEMPFYFYKKTFPKKFYLRYIAFKFVPLWVYRAYYRYKRIKRKMFT